MNITTEDIKKLRDVTGAGMMDAKRALESAATFEDAVTELRKKGHASLAKKAARATKEGLIVSYIHAGGKIGALVELNCETDFVARNEEFKALASEIAMHVAAAGPVYVSREEVPADMIEKEKGVYLEQVKDKPENIKEQILAGKLEKFYEQVCLLDQLYVRDQDKKVKDLIAEKVAKIGENIQIRRFSRFILGAE